VQLAAVPRSPVVDLAAAAAASPSYRKPRAAAKLREVQRTDSGNNSGNNSVNRTGSGGHSVRRTDSGHSVGSRASERSGSSSGGASERLRSVLPLIFCDFQ